MPAAPYFKAAHFAIQVLQALDSIQETHDFEDEAFPDPRAHPLLQLKAGVDWPDKLTRLALIRAARHNGGIITITSSHRGDGSAHDGLGVVDIRTRDVVDVPRLIWSLRAAGFATLDFSDGKKFPAHIHAVLSYHPGLNYKAQQQANR